ncbi:hypothetical protein IGI04_036727 [Brassica rapa subsp. trilocularis]|uniref:Uncharacterized protein n=1 Tax=Brassica rapa subsp. trilocularis TaxID=1813537 RepID=A0ABQ7LG94_BRACM|nr:hypothetical protein IGI04_036727 [Brassica rapa subsp. trilocularis]
MLTKPVSPIPEERFRFRDHDLLLGLANTHTQLPVFLFVLGDQSCDFYMQMQAVILQPLGDKGITVIGGKTTIYMLHVFRIGLHFFNLEKLDATLGRCFIGSAYISQETDRNKYPDP